MSLFLFATDPAIYEIVFSLIGKFCASISAACLYTFTSELFPTNSRAAIVGLCSTIGRIGSIMAPIVADLVTKPNSYQFQSASLLGN